MSAGPCIVDTQTVDLVWDGTNLSANVRRGPTGGLGTDANGLKVGLAASSGLEVISGNTLRVDVVGGGLALSSGGLSKVMQAQAVGWRPGASSGLTAINSNVARGASAQIDTTLQLTITNTSTASTRFEAISTFGVDYQTTFSEFETSNILDAVYLELDRNFNLGGFVAIDFDGLVAFRQYRRVMLKGIDDFAIGPSDAVIYQVQCRSIGGTAGTSAVQGHIKNTFCQGILVKW